MLLTVITFAAKFTFMIIRSYIRLSIAASIALLLFTASSCKKEHEISPAQVALELPSDVNIVYGGVTELSLPNDLIKDPDVTFKLEFNETANIEIANGSKLHDKLIKAVSADKNRGKILIDSRLLYPNGAVSSINGNKVPDDYKVTVIASSSNNAVEGRQTVTVKVSAGKLYVKDLDKKNEVPFAYVLYSDEGISFDLEAPDLPTEGSKWALAEVKDAKSVISLDGNKIKFAASAGDPKKEAEQAYDLEPVLQKDGFPVASTKFRVIFIPQIKFFFGQYYPELGNLTLLFNLVHIGLSNGYVSAAPVLYPEKYKSSFTIISIEKDGKSFDNNEGIFQLNAETGKVTVKQNTTLTAGRYKLMIKAITTTGLEFTTDLTIAMEAF
jgi:hypothetical protein